MNEQPDANQGITPQTDPPPHLGIADQVSDLPDDVVVKAVESELASRNFLARFFTSHPPGFWFFFWGELAERSCYYGMRAILTLYLAEQLGFGDANASTIMSLFIAGCYLLPLLGGFIADNFFGKYWTIVGFSLPYIIGQLLLCIDSQQVLGIPPRYFVFVSLVLLAMGSGVIKPNISTLMGLTYDHYRPGQTQLRSDAFSFFYMAINIGAFASSSVMPYLRTHYGYHFAFAFPAGLMLIALALFALGKPYYAREVITRTEKTPEERRQQWAVLRRLFGLFFVITFFWMVFDQSSSTWILFAKKDFDLHLLGYHVDPDQVQAINPLFIIALLPIVSVALWRWLARLGLNVRATDKMLVGFVVTAVSMGVMTFAGYLASSGEKVSLWWQVLTFFLITVAELCISPVGLELAFTAAPKAMKGFITGCFLLTVFFGNIINSYLVRLYTPLGKTTTLGPVEYFGMLTGVLLVITVAFVFVARRFNQAVEAKPELPSGAGERFRPSGEPSDQIADRDSYRKPE
jgi:POT family proton-dependent oligopeptide transporter